MAVPSTMPRDSSGAYVQVLRAGAGLAHHITTSGVSARNSSAFNADTRAIEIHCTEDCYFQTGNSSITASSADHWLPGGETRVYSVGGDKQAQHTHIAVIQDTTAGTLHVSELE